MTVAAPSEAWFRVFPQQRISEILSYVSFTWHWLGQTFATSVAFDNDETLLTDSLCMALNDGRRFEFGIDCDFQAETWELRRDAVGIVSRIARADIRVILGAPGTPHLVLEFKKLSGSTNDRWRYCFDGMDRFVDGKYGVGHAFGVMCGLSPNKLSLESELLAAYIAEDERAKRLRCIRDATGNVATVPSPTAPGLANFDTRHERLAALEDGPIVLMHTLLPCARAGVSTAKRGPRRRKI